MDSSFHALWWKEMIEEEDYVISVDQLIADINQRIGKIDEHIYYVKELLVSQEISHYQDRALFYAMNLMLEERNELVEEKEKMLWDRAI